MLEIKDVVKQYENHLALDSVSLSIPKGKIYGLLGPNGAGKTTLIRIINQITMPDSGEVLLNGSPIKRDDVELIGYLPEERGLYKKMKVGELILYLAQLKGVNKKEAKRRAEEWFVKMEIGDWWKKKVEELSKGMAQKIQFITTVIHNPTLLIFDEPFSGFDPVNTTLLKNEILELKRRGCTIILSTHNMSSVEELCDEITLIHQSKVMLQGKMSEIKERYKDSIYAVELVESTDSTVEELIADPSLCTVLSVNSKNGVIALRLKKADGVSNSRLIESIARNHEILSFKEELPSMNDIFIKIVRP